MNRRKPTKTCKNLDCNQEFNNYKSDKRKYCCDSCRYRGNFLIQKKRDAALHRLFGRHKDNEKILDNLIKWKNDYLSETDLKNLGFDFNILTDAKVNVNTTTYQHGKYKLKMEKLERVTMCKIEKQNGSNN